MQLNCPTHAPTPLEHGWQLSAGCVGFRLVHSSPGSMNCVAALYVHRTVPALLSVHSKHVQTELLTSNGDLKSRTTTYVSDLAILSTNDAISTYVCNRAEPFTLVY